MVLKIISHILRCLLGLVFIYSAYTKFYPIDNLELFIFGNGIPNWDIASSFARLIISIELFIGIMLLVNIYTKRILQINLIILILFSILLGYFALLKSDITNCNCFGEHLKFTPLESLLKNFGLIAITIFLLKALYPFCFKFQKILFILLLASSFSVPIILSPPDYIYPVKSQIIDKPLDCALLSDFRNDYTNTKIEKTLVCFFSVNCKFCKLAAKKITIIEKNLNIKLPVYYVFFGDEENIEKFFAESESKKYPYQILPPEKFFVLSGSSLPSINFVNNGVIERKSGFRTLNQDEIEEFFNN